MHSIKRSVSGALYEFISSADSYSLHSQAVAKVNSGISASGTEVSVSMAGEADARLSHFADLVPGFQGEANEIIRVMFNFIDEKARIPRNGVIRFWVGAIR